MVSDCACVKEGGVSNVTRGFVPWGSRNFVQHVHHVVGNVRVDYVQTPRGCVHVVLKYREVPQMSGLVGCSDGQSQLECHERLPIERKN